MKLIPLLSFCLLLGCAGYTPQLIGPVNDPVKYSSDWSICQSGAENYKSEFSFQGLATDTVTGATNNLSLFPINPLVVPYGAVGGAGGSLSKTLGVMSVTKNNVARNCIIELTHRDQSALVANPN